MPARRQGGAPAPPPPGEVHVWHGELAGRPSPEDADLLGPEERARYARYLRREDAERYAGAHAAIRRVLARYFGTAPEAVELGRRPCPACGSQEHGPPRAAAGPAELSVSLSHSGAHWLLAVAASGPVGVDVEAHRDAGVEEVARACLSDAELAYLRARPPAERLAAFYRCWTRKEAVVKASGVGLATDLRAVEVAPASPGPVTVRHATGNGPAAWTVWDLPGGPGWSAALARPAATAGAVCLRGDWPAGRAEP